MGSRGASGAKTKSTKNYERVIEISERPINKEKAGASFNAIDAYQRYSISENLKISQVMKDYIREGSTNVSYEWTTSMGKEKIKIITKFDGKKLNYEIKKKNKILLRTTSKEKAANTIAKFYLDASKNRNRT